MEVLQHEGHPAERAVRQRAARLVARPVEELEDDGVEPWVQRLDAADRGVDELDGRDLALRHERRERGTVSCQVSASSIATP